MSQLTDFLVTAGGASLIASSIAAPLTYQLLLKLNSRQTVSAYVPEHAAKQGTPTMGGLIILAGQFTALGLNWGHDSAVWASIIGWFAFIGLLDDFLVPRLVKGKRGLDWIPKLILQTLPFVVLACFGTELWTAAVTGFIVLFFANAYNFVDGLDGLAGGVGLVLAFSLAFAKVETSPLMLGLGMSFVPFLMLNAPPAKVFMGDVGSLPIGALFGLVVTKLLGVATPNPAYELVWPVLLLSALLLVETIPGPLQIASAKLRKGKRLFPFKTPVHHGFQAAGWPETRVTAMFVLVQLVLGLAASWWILHFGDSRQ
ncbi:MAG: hypothetical protein JSS66_02535 [Armatimonadetes bacterium]|nr:hypothetical protein [Armatimonadota bacterium]